MNRKLRFVWGSVRKHFFVLAGLALLAPMAAMADSNLCGTGVLCAIDNTGGKLTDTTAHGLTLTGSHVTLIGTQSDDLPPYLGSITLTTGMLTGGSLAAGGTFAGGVGSNLEITETSGLYHGILFKGTFSGPVNWTLLGTLVGTKCPAGGCTYILSGTVSGTWELSTPETGATVQFTVTTSTPFVVGGSVNLTGGITNVGVVPEPGSLGLMGTGLFGLGFVMRRKAKARQSANQA